MLPRRVLVVGLARSGQAAALALAGRGVHVVGELRERIADEVAVENENRHPPRKNRK